jgi:hypothetical protein
MLLDQMNMFWRLYGGGTEYENFNLCYTYNSVVVIRTLGVNILINMILYFITGFLPCRIISINKKSYLERYYLGGGWFIHRFLSNDGDRHVHNHPWTWAMSFIICGSYLEKLYDKSIVNRKWFNLIRRDTYHQIVSIEPKTWTLFVHSKHRYHTWGFIGKNGYEDAKVLHGHGKYPRGWWSDRKLLR